MANKIHRSILGKIIDTITFPIRVLFIEADGKLGLSSLREERMRLVAPFCKGKVLDIGCGPGNLFIREYIGTKNSIGIDVFPYKGVETIIRDMTNIPFDDYSFDTITLIAMVSHIPRSKRVAEFKEFIRLLKPGGRIIVTKGDNITQYLNHKWRKFYLGLYGKLDMDSERGMEEDEEYCISTKELLSYLNTPPLKFIKKKRSITQWGFNSVYIAQKYLIT